jgi:hypothetical protein
VAVCCGSHCCWQRPDLCCAVLCPVPCVPPVPEDRPSPDMLGARMSVSPTPTPAGISIAVAASRGRVACLTASLSVGGAVQLSSPVLYAVPYAGPLETTVGKSYWLRKRPTMELGDIIDLVLLPAANSGRQQQQQVSEHLAVMHHRYKAGCWWWWQGSIRPQPFVRWGNSEYWCNSCNCLWMLHAFLQQPQPC